MAIFKSYFDIRNVIRKVTHRALPQKVGTDEWRNDLSDVVLDAALAEEMWVLSAVKPMPKHPKNSPLFGANYNDLNLRPSPGNHWFISGEIIPFSGRTIQLSVFW